MTPDRFRANLGLLGWNTPQLALRWRVDDRTIRRWKSGEMSIPPAIAAWVEDLARWLETHPPPDGGQRG